MTEDLTELEFGERAEQCWGTGTEAAKAPRGLESLLGSPELLVCPQQ